MLFEFILNTIKEGCSGKIRAVTFAEMKEKRLSEMKPMEKGVIGRVECPEAAMALVEMGCCPGEEVTVAHVAPGNGPMAIFSGGRKLALRRKAAEMLWMLPVAAQQAQSTIAEAALQIANS